MRTRVTELFGIRYPIVQGGLAHLAFAELCAAVSNAGGLGQISAATIPGGVAATATPTLETTPLPPAGTTTPGANLTGTPVFGSTPATITSVTPGGTPPVSTTPGLPAPTPGSTGYPSQGTPQPSPTSGSYPQFRKCPIASYRLSDRRKVQ